MSTPASTRPNPASAEKRRAERVRVLISGEAIDSAQGKRFPVFVRDMSETGARLWSDAARLPSQFVLRLPSQSLELPCAVVWRDGLECGVQFERPAS
jgi:PilZ domain